MEKPGASLVEREGLESVIENARKSAEAGYPDNPASDPATFDADFIIEREREGMSLGQALQALVAFNVARGEVASVFIVLFRQRLQQLIQRPCPPDVPVIIKAIGDQSMLFEQVAGDGQNFSRYHSISTLQMTDVFCRADGRRLMEQE